MGAYQYQAIQPSGLNTRGVIEADSLRHARQLIRTKGLIPTHVAALKKRTVSSRRNKLKSKNLALITRQLATLLASGMPIEEALYGVSAQMAQEKTANILIGVRTKVMEGFSLAQAMGDFPDAFPELYRATVASGEHTGHLDVVLEKLADYIERQQETRQKIEHALIYPIIMLVVSTIILGFLLAFVVPKIIEVFSGNDQPLPIMTRALIQVSNMVQNYGLYVLGIIIISFYIFKKSLNKKNFKYKWHQFLLKIPTLSFLIKYINASRYIHTFHILFASGVGVLETMRVAASVVNNLPMQDAFNKAITKVREGGSLNNAFKETKFFTPMSLYLIASGEKSGQIAPMMQRAGNQLDNDVKRFTDTALTLLEPGIILFMGGIVLFIVLATLLPIFSMEQLIL